MGTYWQESCPALILVWLFCSAFAFELGHSFLYPEEDSSKDERNLAFEGNSNLGVDGSTSFEGGVFSVNHLYKTHRGYSSSDLSIPAVAPKYYKELTFQEDDASDSSPLKAVPDFINMAAHQASPDLENENLRARISNGHLWNDVLTDISNVLYDVNWRADLLDGESSPFNFYGVFSLSKSDKVWGDQSPAFVLPPKNESSCGKDGAHHHHYPHSVGCNMANMTVVFKGHPKELFVQVNSSTLLDISNLLPKCKYDINGKHGSFHFTTPYNGCYVKKLGDCFVLNLVWKNKPVVLSCPAEPTPILLTFCQRDKMTIVLPEGPLDLLKVKDRFNKWITAYKIAHKCKYLVWRDSLGRIVFSASFKACHVMEMKDDYVLTVSYKSAGATGQVVMSCPVETHVQHPYHYLDFPNLLCAKNGIIIHLPKWNLQAIQLKDVFGNAVNIEDVAEDCDFRLIRDMASVTLIASFESCNVKLQGKQHVLTVKYIMSGMNKSVNVRCEQSMKPRIHCRVSNMTIELPHGPLEKVFIKSQLNKLIAVKDAPKYCRYHLVRDRGMNLLTASYLSCDVKTVNYNYVLPVFYTSASGKQGSVNMECPATTGKPRVICRRSSMTVYLPKVPIEQIRLRNHHGKTVPIHAAKHCHYILMEGNRRLIFTTSYKACDVQIKHRHYILTVVYTSDTKGEASVEMKCPVEETETIPSQSVTCGKSGMTMLLPKGSPEDVKIIDYLGNEVAVRNVSKPCQYMLEKHWNGSVSFTAHYRSCDVKLQGGYYMLTVLYKPLSGPKLVGHMRCPASDQSSHTPHDFPVVICESTSMMVELPVASDVKVLDADKEHHILGIAKECGYKLREKENTLLFTTTYDGCHVRILDGHYSLTVVYRSIGEEKFWLQMKCPVQAYPGQSTPPAIVPTKPIPYVTCKNASMTVMLPDSNLDGITVKDAFGQEVQVDSVPSYCGYQLVRSHGKINFTSLYGACDVSIEHGKYVLTVGYKLTHGPKKYITLRCPVLVVPADSSSVICKYDGMNAVLPDGKLNKVKIINMFNEELIVNQAPVECGYSLVKVHGKITLTVRYTSCDVTVKHNMYWLTVLYTPAKGTELSLTMSCPVVAPSVPTTTTVMTPSSQPTVICGSSSMRVILPNGSPDWVRIINNSGYEAQVVSQPRSCGYLLEEGHNYLSFTTSYQACDVTILGSFYVLTVIYAPEVGQQLVVNMKCPNASGDFGFTTLPPLTSQKPSTLPPSPTVFCQAASMMLVLPGLHYEIQILDKASGRVAVNRSCGYTVTKHDGSLIFSALYDACDVNIQHHHYVLTVLYKSAHNPWKSVTMRCPVKVPTTAPPTKPTIQISVTCRAKSMIAILPDGPTDQVKLVDLLGEAVPVSAVSPECGYVLRKVKGKIIFTVPYDSCEVSVEEGDYVLVVVYQPFGGVQMSITLRCPVGDVIQTTAPSPFTSKNTTTLRSLPTSTTMPAVGPSNVMCSDTSMMVTLPKALPDSIKIIDKFHQVVAVVNAPVSCGYKVVIGFVHLVFITSYTACDIRIVDGFYVLTMYYTTENGQQMKVHMKCPTSSGDAGLSTTIPPTNVVKSTPSAPPVTCNFFAMSVMLPEGSPTDVLILDNRNEAVPVNQLPSRCGYVLRRKPGGLLLTAQYTSCDVRIKNQFYMLSVLYTPSGGVETSVTMQCPVIQPPTTMSTTTTMPVTPSIPLVICQEFTMEAILPAGLLSQVKITDFFNQSMAVNQAPNECGYTLRKAGGKIVFSTPYDACDVYIKYNQYILTVLYQPYGHSQKSVTMSCPVVEPTQPTTTTTTTTTKPTTSIAPPKTLCRGSSMMVVLPGGAPENVKIIDKLHREVPVITAPKSCGYTLVKQYKQLVFASLYTACDVQIKGGFYVLLVVYTTPNGVKMKVHMKCPTTGSLFPTTLAPTTRSIWTTPSAPILICKASNMMVLLPMGSINDVKVIVEKNEALPVVQAPRDCGYLLEKRPINLAFSALYTSCNIRILRNHYVLNVLYSPDGGMEMSVTMRCPIKVPTTTKMPSSTSTLSTKGFTPIVICRSSSMMVTLPDGSPQSVGVLDALGEQVAVTQQPSSCGYTLIKTRGNLQFTALYKACDVQIIGGSYVLDIMYQPSSGPEIAVQMECPTTFGDGLTTITTMPSRTTIFTVSIKPTVICSSTSMTAMLPDGSLDDVQIIDLAHEVVPVTLTPQGCGYALERKRGSLFFFVKYTACDINILNNNYVLTVLYKPAGGSIMSLTMSCPVGVQMTTMTTTLSKPYTPSPPVTCGESSMSVTLPYGPLDQVKIVSFNETVAVYQALPECGYILRRVGRKMVLKVPYDACDVYIWHNTYIVTVLYVPAHGVQSPVTMRCPVIKPSPPTIATSTRITTHILSSAVICRGLDMMTNLPDGHLEEVHVIDKHYKEVAVVTRPKSCGYTLVKRNHQLSFTALYKSCDVRISGGFYLLMVIYKHRSGSQMRVQMRCSTTGADLPEATTTATSAIKPLPLPIACKSLSMMVELPVESLQDILLIGDSEQIPVVQVPRACGYTLIKALGHVTFSIPYKGCHVNLQGGHYVLEVLYKPAGGMWKSLTIRCPTQDLPVTTTAFPASLPKVICGSSGMRVLLPNGSAEDVKVLDKNLQKVPAIAAPEHCGYAVQKGPNYVSFSALYTACDMSIVHHHYILTVYYKTARGTSMVVDMKCPLLFTPSTPVTVKPETPPVMCHKSAMSVRLPTASVQLVKILDKVGKEVSVVSLASKCGYHLVKEKDIYFSVPYTACDVKILDHHYVLTVIYTSFAGHRTMIHLRCPVPAPSPIEAGVSCLEDCMSIELPLGPLNEVKVVDSFNSLVVVVSQAPKSCGFSLVEEATKLVFSAAYKGCHVKTVSKHYELTIVHQTSTGEKLKRHMMCPVQRIVAHQGCNLPRNKQVTCGPPGAKPHSCLANGCCVDEETSHCYYPMDTCTADGHFVFAVYRTASKPEVDPATLVVSGNQSCLPVICTPEFAIFKFPVTGCGTYVFVIAETTIYVAEVQGLIRRKLQTYGLITRDSPFRLQVECHYSKGSLTSTGYLVMNVSPPPASISSGQLGVSLRIAIDESYSSFYPYSQVPLSFLLGKTVYLELLLVNPPEPNMVLLVHYCIAYPRSSMNAWVLIYEGCPRNESAVNLILKDLAGYPLPKYIRRFNLQTFQFLDPRTWKHLDEEVYFMCSTEICPAAPHACNEGCFDGRIMPSPASDALDKRCSGSLCPKSAHIAKRAIEGAVAMSEKLNPENFHLYGNPFYKLTLLFLGLLCLVAAAAALLIIRNAMQDVH
ncbi:uncharacterized protein LOC120523999 isoform X2 [Polypterus senegalus]|uniref:uncharacterized protein LOC120523999 isoform X2 n=1 Tax=Polypterus senegalus TaxID=55291 RepID=UPI0019658128|nr:uncharacterized protein LOC120523999 isoform X2 [Polypterus senegalus]